MVSWPAHDEPSPATTLDISASGLLIRTVHEPRPGDRVRLRLRLPQTGVWVDADGEVTRIVAGRRQSDGGPAFAVRVRRMNGMARVLLQRMIDGVPPPVPARGVRKDYANMIHRIANGD